MPTNQGTPKTAWSYKERGLAQIFPPGFQEGTCAANSFILDLRPPSCERSISAVLSPHLWSLVTVIMGTKTLGSAAGPGISTPCGTSGLG